LQNKVSKLIVQLFSSPILQKNKHHANQCIEWVKFNAIRQTWNTRLANAINFQNVSPSCKSSLPAWVVINLDWLKNIKWILIVQSTKFKETGYLDNHKIKNYTKVEKLYSNSKPKTCLLFYELWCIIILHRN